MEATKLTVLKDALREIIDAGDTSPTRNHSTSSIKS